MKTHKNDWRLERLPKEYVESLSVAGFEQLIIYKHNANFHVFKNLCTNAYIQI